MSFSSLLLLAALLTGMVPAWAAPEPTSLGGLKLTQLEQRLKEINRDLSLLAKTSLRTGVGSIGYRSQSSNTGGQTEWVEIEFDGEYAIDCVVVVPVLWRDSEKGFQTDGFPESFRILAKTAANPEGVVIKTYASTAGLLPRLAPVVIPAKGIRASSIRIEATRLTPRSFDQKFLLQLSEVLVFSGEKNVALRRPVILSSPPRETHAETPWAPRFLVDGHTPYEIDAAEGESSMAYINPIIDRPVLAVDLESPHLISSVHLHAVDQSDTVPQAYAGDLGIPRHLKIEGATLPDFSDAVTMLRTDLLSINDIGPIMMWNIPETRCRYVRFSEVNPSKSFRIGFSEIELFSNGSNVALGKRASKAGGDFTYRSLDAMTDGRNLYGNILPIRTWMHQLARRHELEAERPLIQQELALRYERQKNNLRRISWLAVFLLFGGITAVVLQRINRQRAISRTRERIAANLHDELGANLHAIGLLGDFAKKIVTRKNAQGEWAELAEVVDEVRALTEETGETARYCTNMLETKEIHKNVVGEMKRASARLLADLQHEATFPEEEKLHILKPRNRIDLYLFYKECLTNILRHSGATHVSTRLTANDRGINMSVTDNGHGLPGNEIPKSLRRRARMLGASVTAEKPAAGGTQITLQIRPRGIFRFIRS